MGWVIWAGCEVRFVEGATRLTVKVSVGNVVSPRTHLVAATLLVGYADLVTGWTIFATSSVVVYESVWSVATTAPSPKSSHMSFRDLKAILKNIRMTLSGCKCTMTPWKDSPLYRSNIHCESPASLSYRDIAGLQSS